MKTSKRYIHGHIRLCRTCGGTGRVTCYAPEDILQAEPHTCTCGDCGGTGRVVISGEVTINTAPYDGKDDGSGTGYRRTES